MGFKQENDISKDPSRYCVKNELNKKSWGRGADLKDKEKKF